MNEKELPAVVLFDIDNTLTESKQPLTNEMTELMSELLRRTKAAITSGAKFSLAKEQIADPLPEEVRPNFYMLPTSGAALYVYTNGAWETVYEERLSDAEVTLIRDALTKAGTETGLIDFSAPAYGERIEFRGSQVALSPLGQQAPTEEKRAWDPDRSKRITLLDAISPLLPAYEVRTGGYTTIDVTKPGINKAFGVRKLSEYLHIPIEKMLYIGDALFPGGNDEVVKETGIKTQQVLDPAHTARVIQALLDGTYVHEQRP